MDSTEGAGAADTAGTGAMYTFTGAGAADTAGAGEMYSTTGADAADTAGAGATYSSTVDTCWLQSMRLRKNFTRFLREGVDGFFMAVLWESPWTFHRRSF